MARNAIIKIDTLTAKKAIYRINENMRLGTKYDKNANIFVIENHCASTSFEKEKNERSKDDKDVAKKINAINASIRTYQKRIDTLDYQNDHQRISKMQKKIFEYKNEIENMKMQKSGIETRGRKKEKQFVEFTFSLTNTEPTNDNLNNRFAQAQAEYLKKYFGTYELVTNVVHLDQTSLHAHAIVKLPTTKTWTELILKKTKLDAVLLTEHQQQSPKRSSKHLYDALKQSYANIARHFQNFMSKELDIKFDKLKNGVFYTGLQRYKKETMFDKYDDDFVAKTETMYEEFLASKNEKDEQMYEKQEKNDFRANSDDLNDTNTEPVITKQRRQR